LAGIYIHIPYCRKACIYCNFHFSTSLNSMDEMVESICKEMLMRKEDNLAMADTLYFGGGTPGILPPEQLKKIIDQAFALYNISSAAEISLEVNPDDITPGSLEAWKAAGVNRLSVGIQSFDEEELKWMNRTHGSERSMQALQEIRKAGFDNFSADLIFGSPLSGREKLKKNIDLLLQLEAPHISCYALTVEPRTRLDKMILNRTSPSPDQDEQADQFLYVMERLLNAGYEHYEISNFARPGFRSRHNSSYWRGIPYLGFGPSAHSFDGLRTRSFNVSDNRQYIQMITEGLLPSESELLSNEQQLNEMIMISLRTCEGLDLNAVKEKFGAGQTERILLTAADHLNAGHINLKNDVMQLTEKGKLMADGIAADLFCDGDTMPGDH
jgi:oxygen-independent coproporphyrinogen-3 oxidase